MLQKQVKELTEGMQSLCAIANKVVSSEGRVEAIERDLLLDALRRLYDTALQLEVRGTSAPAKPAEPEPEEENEAMPDAEIISSTVMATMAAMGVAAEPEAQPANTMKEDHASEQAVVEPEPEVQPANTLKEDYASEQPVVVEPEPVIAEPEPVEPEPAAEPETVSMAGFEAESGLLFDEIVVEGEPEAQPANTLEEDYASEQPEAQPADSSKEDYASEQPEPAKEQSSLLDYLRHPVQEQPATRTLGESLGGGATVESTFERTVSRKVDDLRTVININDKFSFMSELFRNNMRAYNDFIMYLNSLSSREEALAYVKQTAEQYKWDENSLAVKAFYKVFDMKF
jgi:hypothetical protein